jgi:hypothetical protein
MKLSSQTLSLLKSFAGINSNLLIREGNHIATRNATGSIQARATVEEEFPRNIAIYDLNQFLGLVSVSSDPDIDFEITSLQIRSATGGVIKYHYAEESLIKAVPDTEPEISTTFQFILTNSDMSVIQKTASIVAATTLSVTSSGSGVSLVINDPKNPSSNSYSKMLGDSNETFTMRVSIDNIRPVVDDTYEVVLGTALAKNGMKVPVFRFNSTNRNLKYLIAADPTSKIG